MLRVFMINNIKEQSIIPSWLTTWLTRIHLLTQSTYINIQHPTSNMLLEMYFQLNLSGTWNNDVFTMFFQLLTVMNLLVSLKMMTPWEPLSTNITHKRPLTSVNPHMNLQAGCNCTLIVTNLALIRPLTRVNPHMHLQVGCILTLIFTHFTLEWSFTGMYAHVCPQYISMSTLIPTYLTYEGKFLWMYQHVTFQIRWVGEAPFTFSTLEWLLLCVNSLMWC